MSLLMDALKRAEQEKKDAAKRLVSTEEDMSASRREPIGNVTEPHPIIQEHVIEYDPERQNYKPDTIGPMDMSLEPIESSGSHPELQQARENSALQIEIKDLEPASNLDVTDNRISINPEFKKTTTAQEVDGDLTQEVNLGLIVNALEMTDPDQTIHGIEIGKSPVTGQYDDTLQGEPFKPAETDSYSETLPGVPAAQLARDIGIQDQPTPVAAQTVFTATNRITKFSSGSTWLLISLCIIAIGSTVTVYYYSGTPVIRNLPSPLVAKGVESIISGADIQPIATAGVIAPIVTASESTSSADTLLPDQAPADTATTDTPQEVQQPEITETPVSEPEPAVAETMEEANVLPARFEPPPSLVKISRTLNTGTENQLVTEAFDAYQQANYELARQKYEQAFEQSPDNRDVLLGLAAVASKTGDTTRAQQTYYRLVQLNPLDNVARAALINIQPGESLSGNISAVKSMLFESPEQASLYFTLGRLYSIQLKWSEAQQAFFDAYRLDSSNPDYAFNLAVSLDHLDQTQSALDYYTVALGLSETNPAGFNSDAVSNRIRTLEPGQ